MRPDKTDSTSSTDTAAIHKNKTDCDKTVPDKQSWTKQQWKEFIRETPVGKRVLPMEYVKKFYNKPSDMSWESFLDIMNDKFKVTQQDEIEKIAKKEQEWEAERQKQIEYEAEQKRMREKQEEEEREKERQRLLKLKQEQEKAEEENRKKVEEAQRKADLERKQKEDQEKREAQQIAEKAAKDLFDLDGFDEDEKPTPTPPEPVKVKVEKDPTGDDATTDLGEHVQKIYDKNEQNYKIAVKNYELNKNIETYLNEVGTLIVHPDVVYALNNLKTLGHIMRKKNETTDETSEKPTRPESSRNLFPETVQQHSVQQPIDMQQIAKEIKQENGSVSTAQMGMSPSGFSSPPAAQRKMFSGMKRHTPQSFVDLVSKRRKTGSTPVRQGVISPVTSPNRPSNSVEEAKSKADAMCKAADLGATFIKNKKITASNVQVIYDNVSEQHNREIIEYHEDVQSFYKIMTHYVPLLGMIPEDTRYLELKKNLFEFVMKNTEYTKVRVLFFPSFLLNVTYIFILVITHSETFHYNSKSLCFTFLALGGINPEQSQQNVRLLD